MSEEQLYQAITFVVIVSLFDILERRRPGFLVHRYQDLLLNLLAMIVVIVGGELCRRLLLYGFSAINLREVFSHNVFLGLPGAIKMLLGVALGDLSLYWVHRAMHRPVLWRTHAFHHTIGEIWWLAGSRTSLTHLFLFAVPQVLIAYYILGLTALEIGVVFSFGVVVNLWIHTNLWVNLGFLEWIFITPNYHRIHHGARGLTNKNLGFVFTVWDRMFGTYVSPQSTGKEFALLPIPWQKRLLRMLIGF
jgi:sterol desaturase/sphingolipid hydroxylase (fatty acid hydroxylase superfamily)